MVPGFPGGQALNMESATQLAERWKQGGAQSRELQFQSFPGQTLIPGLSHLVLLSPSRFQGSTLAGRMKGLSRGLPATSTGS